MTNLEIAAIDSLKLEWRSRWSSVPVSKEFPDGIRESSRLEVLSRLKDHPSVTNFTYNPSTKRISLIFKHDSTNLFLWTFNKKHSRFFAKTMPF